MLRAGAGLNVLQRAERLDLEHVRVRERLEVAPHVRVRGALDERNRFRNTFPWFAYAA